MNAQETNLNGRVEDIMQRVPRRIRPTDSVHDTIETLIDHGISALPVVDDKEQLVGIISVNDILSLLHSIEHSLEDSFPRYEDCYWVVELIQQRFGSDYVSSVMTEVIAKCRLTIRSSTPQRECLSISVTTCQLSQPMGK